MSRGREAPANRNHTDDRLGQLLNDRYRLRKVIARGAMGSVYLADQLPLDRPVAVKILDLPSEQDDPEKVRTRFLREASTLARMEHPNTVRIYDFGYWNGTPFLVMEFVDGFSLRRLQSNGPIPAVRVVDIASQICAALREAHGMGIIHRDLKPANILLTRHAGALDVVKIVDFGLAKGFYGQDQDLTQNGQVLGTPMYMSPEQIRDDECDPRSDIYSLGVVLYRSFTGETPFPKGSTAEVLMANLYDAPRPFEVVRPGLDLPPALEWVVGRCMEKKPEDRFANVAELQKALKACRRALEDPAMRHLQLSVNAGHTVLPDDASEASYSSLHLPQHQGGGPRGPQQSGGHSQRNIPVARTAASALPGAPAPSAPSFASMATDRLAEMRGSTFGGVPDWVVVAALLLLAVLGVVAGVAVGKRMQAPKADIAPVADVQPAAAAAPAPPAPEVPKPPKGPPAPPRSP